MAGFSNAAHHDAPAGSENQIYRRKKAFADPAYAKLDANHDGRLDFDEYSAKAIAKFTGAFQSISMSDFPADPTSCSGDKSCSH